MTNNIGITKKVRLKNYYGEYLEPYVDNTDIENDIQQINNTLLQINTNFVNKNSQTDKNAVVNWGMPDYTNKITTSNTSGSSSLTYTAPARGWVYVTQFMTGSNNYVVTINGNNVANFAWQSTQAGGRVSRPFFVEKDDVLYATASSSTAGVIIFDFFSLKGGN